MYIGLNNYLIDIQVFFAKRYIIWCDRGIRVLGGKVSNEICQGNDTAKSLVIVLDPDTMHLCGKDLSCRKANATLKVYIKDGKPILWVTCCIRYTRTCHVDKLS